MNFFRFAVVAFLLLLLVPRAGFARQLHPSQQDQQDTGPWLPLKVAPVPEAKYLETALSSNHQGDHVKDECQAVLDKDGLRLFFPMNPAYHLEIDITVKKDGGQNLYQAEIFWAPLNSAYRVKNSLASQSLTLDRSDFALNQPVNGYLDLTFTVTELEGGAVHTYFVKGPFSAMVREPGFDPYAEENIASYTEPALALHHLGPNGSHIVIDMRHPPTEPLEGSQDWEAWDLWGVWNDPQIAAERQKFLERDPKVQLIRLHEMNWRPDEIFGGTTRITIWYQEVNGGWRQMGFAKWEWAPDENEP